MAITDLFGVSAKAQELFQWLNAGSTPTGYAVSYTPFAVPNFVVVGNNAAGAAPPYGVILSSNDTSNRFWRVAQNTSLPTPIGGMITYDANVFTMRSATAELGFRQIAQTFSSASSVVVTNTTTQTTVRTLSVNSMPTNRVIRWTEQVTMTNGSGSTQTFIIRVTAQSAVISFGVSLPFGSSATAGILDTIIEMIPGSTTIQILGKLTYGPQGNQLITGPTIVMGGDITGTAQTTNPFNITSSIQMSTANTTVTYWSMSWLVQSING